LSSISGVSTYYAGGGGGGITSGAAALGGSGGGGAGAVGSSSTVGQSNGGSGVVILSYPSDYLINLGAGLTGFSNVIGENRVTTITAGNGNISWEAA
jgi:hypothetical protein